ncbi:unnamed protein product [Brassica rapa subsp. trilocularis]
MRPSCLFRWELYPFFKAFDNITLASPPPPPVAALPPAVDQASTIHNEDIKGISVGIVAAITIPNVAVLILLVPREGNMNQNLYTLSLQLILIFQLHIHHNTILRKIDAATNRFSSSNKLGEGGFGEVHKGKLPNGTEVAVKRLSKTSGQGIREFKNEAVLVKRFSSMSLSQTKALTISYLVWLYSLQYFILYPNDIFSNFGLSTIFGTEQIRGDTNKIAGTFCKYFSVLICHLRSDVYSFGVLVLEIISRGKNSIVYQMDESSTAGNLVTNVVFLPNSHDLVPQFNKGLLQFLIRPRKLGSFNHGVERVQVLLSTSRLGFDHDPIRNRDHRIHILRPCTRELRTVSATRRSRFVYSSSRFSSVSLPACNGTVELFLCCCDGPWWCSTWLEAGVRHRERRWK